MKTAAKIMLLLLIAVLSSCFRKEISVIDKSRIVTLEIKHHTFDNRVKTTKIKVLDVLAENTKKIFDELFENNFPVYDVAGYENRNITNGKKASLHAYGGAIDINPYINPYLNLPKGSSNIEPRRFVNRKKDERKIRKYLASKNIDNEVFDKTEIDAVVKAIVQNLGSDDWFINRDLLRKGMLTKKEAEIFEKHGFTIWGGMWRQPMDFMHFQIPRKLAKRLALTSKEEGKAIFANHILITKYHLTLKKN